MDSTPIPPQPQPQPQPLSIKPSAAKLPIKRKTPDQSLTPNADPKFLTPRLESIATFDDSTLDFDSKPPPFKFHRIWTEPDEIRFLQGLLDASSDGLSFPRDLSVFYTHFSNSMSQPYTKSQLSEKLRRLRKKFRVISLRLARGLEVSLLSPHDRALYDLSKKLWSPEFSSSSPFGKNSGRGDISSNKNNIGKRKSDSNSNLVGVKVSFSPILPLSSHSNINDHDFDDENDNDGYDFVNDDSIGKVRMSEVNVGYDFGGQEEELGKQRSGVDGCGIGGIVAKSVLDVFDESLKEVRMVLVRQGLRLDNWLGPAGSSSGSSRERREKDFERRWREQQVAELDLLARRLREEFGWV